MTNPMNTATLQSVSAPDREYRSMHRRPIPQHEGGGEGDWALIYRGDDLDAARDALSRSRAMGWATRIVDACVSVSGGERIVEQTSARTSR